MTKRTAQTVEQSLRYELAQGDMIISAAKPILRHLLANDDYALFSDAVIARIRGMMGDVARQLLFKLAAEVGAADLALFVGEAGGPLEQAVLSDAGFLAHAHALTLEAQLTERLHERSGILPVLSPLLQEQIAADDAEIAAAAIRVLAAQARFIQQQRRMELPLAELPADLFHQGLLLMRRHAGGHDESAAAVERSLRTEYDESRSRTGQIARLVMSMNTAAPSALALSHAGLAIFATALSMASDQPRDLAVLSFSERQSTRLALAMRASGLTQAEVEEQFLHLHPGLILPYEFDTVPEDLAAAMLGAAMPEKVR